jgi:hypothetical protein
MNNIQLKKLARKIQKSYRDSLQCYFEQRTSDIRYNGKAYEKCKKDIDKYLTVSKTIPQIDTKSVFGKKEKNLSYQEKALLEVLTTRVPTVEYFFNELRYVRKVFKPIKLKKNILIATTKDIVLDGIELGPFEMHLDIDKISKIEYIGDTIVNPVKPNYAPGCDSYPHPNVECNYLCTGAGETSLWYALTNARIFDYFEIVNNILNTYGSANPFMSLDSWNGECCYECGEVENKETISECYYCEGNYLCSCCDRRCVACDDSVCHDCGKASYCYSCDHTICVDCGTKCNICGEMCSDIGTECSCLTKASCCKSIVCGGCSDYCNSCNSDICNDHVDNCIKCHTSMCVKCIKEHKDCSDE